MIYTDADIVTLLRDITKMALLPYPFSKDSPVRDMGLVFCLGQIAGLAMKAVTEHESNETNMK